MLKWFKNLVAQQEHKADAENASAQVSQHTLDFIKFKTTVRDEMFDTDLIESLPANHNVNDFNSGEFSIIRKEQ